MIDGVIKEQDWRAGRLAPRTGLDVAVLAVLRAVDRACTWGTRRPTTAPTTRAVRQLTPDGLSPDQARARLAALGHPWRTLHPLLRHDGNWGWRDGDEPADDEYTRVGLSPLGRLALHAADAQCGPVPLGLVLGDLHPRYRKLTESSSKVPVAAADPTPALGGEALAMRPGFGLSAVLDALTAARAGDTRPSRLLPVPPAPAEAAVDVDLPALLAGEPVRARLGCRFDVVPAPEVPPAPPGPPPEVIAAAQAQGLTDYAWVAYAPRQYAGPSLVVTGTPSGVDLGLLVDQLLESAFELKQAPMRIAGIDDASTSKVGTRVLVHTDDPHADIDALRAWVQQLPAATVDVTWHLPGGADAALHHWANLVDDDDSGLQQLAALSA
ncbi:hypothetical protein [Quadrisphaera granulorum]|uniref:hypothetical protein n=1 Tax=Quadrisphaera granulorum TaxID=317664 RepID=UPI000D6AA66F|nr:hypothetical protein [Quadrisphaera granulorum]